MMPGMSRTYRAVCRALKAIHAGLLRILDSIGRGLA